MQSVKLTYTSVEQNQIRFCNVLMMLKRRGYIKDITSIYKSHKPESMINTIFKFKSDISDLKIAINFITNNINSIPKNSSVDDFLGQNINMIKILCVPSISKKLFKQVAEYPNGEVFELSNFDEDIISKHFISEHTILSEEEKKVIVSQYKLTNLPKIHDCEMMSRYYKAKVGDIMKIERNNVNSGISHAYRLVISGNIELFF